MKTCKTCKWWQKDERSGVMKITDPVDPDTYEPMDMPWEVRFCLCPRVRFFERPVGRNEAAVVDGSEYWARLCTGPEFGCVLHEESDTSNTESMVAQTREKSREG